MDKLKYWKQKHLKYSEQDWITKPTIFAKFAIGFFPPTGKLLELGAGQGQDSLFFAKKGYEVLCTDFSEEAQSIAKRNSIESNLIINFKNVDLSKPLPFPKNTFDIVYSHLGIHYFNKRRTNELLEEIFTILKNGGTLALLLNTLDDPEINNSSLIERDFYATPSGLEKRYFSKASLKEALGNKYEIVVLDNLGETYKDEIKTLIRFIGRKE